MAHNGLGIGEEWGFEKLMLISVPKLNSSRMLKYSNSAHFLPIPCYGLARVIKINLKIN